MAEVLLVGIGRATMAGWRRETMEAERGRREAERHEDRSLIRYGKWLRAHSPARRGGGVHACDGAGRSEGSAVGSDGASCSPTDQASTTTALSLIRGQTGSGLRE